MQEKTCKKILSLQMFNRHKNKTCICKNKWEKLLKTNAAIWVNS